MVADKRKAEPSEDADVDLEASCSHPNRIENLKVRKLTKKMPEGEVAESGDTGAGTSLLYTLAIFYLLIATFIIILSWVVPGIVVSASVAFTLLGAIIFVAAVVQVVYTAEVAAALCGSCPAPAPGT